MGNQEGDQVGNGQAYPRIAINKKRATRNNHTRNPDGTYRPSNNGNQNYGDPMELDTTRKRPRFNILREEFQRRIREQLCLKCAQPGHLAWSCPTKDGPKPFNAQTRSWQPAKKTDPWQNRPKIRQMEVEQEPAQSGNDDCHQ